MEPQEPSKMASFVLKSADPPVLLHNEAVRIVSVVAWKRYQAPELLPDKPHAESAVLGGSGVAN